jgi:hypothetical protein
MLSRIQFLWITAALFILGCLSALYVNLTYYHFPGNEYIPQLSILSTCIIFFLVAIGLKLQFDYENYFSRAFKELSMGLLIFTVIIGGAGIIQFTPYAPIDSLLVQSDQLLHVNVNSLVTWLHAWPTLKSILEVVYEGLCLELIAIPLLLILLRRYALLYQYYTLMFVSAIIGYGLYYFFPTIAPASIFGGEFFTADQHATGVKFYELHHYLQPSTQEGGLISFPSFHVIWAWFLVYLVRCWRSLFIVLSCWNSVLVLSCVLLGWHYAVDVLGSIGVILLTHWIDRFFINDARYFFRCEH